MQIKKRIKKGFTLVELVVVIAVIAILAAVSIGAYFGITDSANRSADEQAVTQMNTMLETYEILNGKVDDVEEAKDIFEDNGLTDYTPFYGKNTFYWTYDDSRVIIWEEEKGVTYPSWAVEKYKSYSESLKTSADWYNLEEEITVHGYDSTFNNIGDFIKDFEEDSIVRFDENITYMVSDGEFYDLYKAFSNSDMDTLTIDLNGSTLDSDDETYVDDAGENGLHSLDVPVNKTLIIENGTIDIEVLENEAGKGMPSAIYLYTGSRLVLRNVTLNSDCSGLFIGSPAAELIIDNCVINADFYGVGTNASTTADIYTKLIVRNSEINAQEAIFLNVKGSIEIDNSVVNSDFHPVALRTGTIKANNCDFNYNDNPSEDYFACYKAFSKDNRFGTYGSGNAFPVCSVMLGNHTNYSTYPEDEYHPYAGDVYASFNNCNFNTLNPENAPQLLLSADNFTSVNVNFSGCNIDNENIVQYEAISTHSNFITNNTGTIQINGTLYNYTDNKYSA